MLIQKLITSQLLRPPTGQPINHLGDLTMTKEELIKKSKEAIENLNNPTERHERIKRLIEQWIEEDKNDKQ